MLVYGSKLSPALGQEKIKLITFLDKHNLFGNMENIFWHCKKLTKFSFPSPRVVGNVFFHSPLIINHLYLNKSRLLPQVLIYSM
jgi:hypothetical protein